MDPSKESVSNEKTLSESCRYGLKEVFNLIYMGNSNTSKLALGIDLSSLELDVNSPDALKDVQLSRDSVDFKLPACYYMNSTTLKLSYLKRFTAETLFYIFYTIVYDMWQGYAASELYSRGWFYHKEWQKWFLYNKESSEGFWTYFEPAVWSKRFCNEDIDSNDFLHSDVLCSVLNDRPPYVSEFDDSNIMSEYNQDVSSREYASNFPELNHSSLPPTIPVTNLASNNANDPLAYSSFNAEADHRANYGASKIAKDSNSHFMFYDNMNCNNVNDHYSQIVNLIDSSNRSNGTGARPEDTYYNIQSAPSPLYMGTNDGASVFPPQQGFARACTKTTCMYKSPHVASNMDYLAKQPSNFSNNSLSSKADAYQLLLKSLSQYQQNADPKSNIFMNVFQNKQQNFDPKPFQMKYNIATPKDGYYKQTQMLPPQTKVLQKMPSQKLSPQPNQPVPPQQLTPQPMSSQTMSSPTLPPQAVSAQGMTTPTVLPHQQAVSAQQESKLVSKAALHSAQTTSVSETINENLSQIMSIDASSSQGAQK